MNSRREAPLMDDAPDFLDPPFRGMTLIDVVVGVSIMTLVFLAIFGAFKLSIELVFSTKAKTGAVSLMTERLEYIRSLPYAAIGTAGGIPAGAVPQLEQVALNGIAYTVRTLIQYTDAPEDGLGAADTNGVTADYKTAKVEVLWSVRGSPRQTLAVTTIAPAGVETLAGGGTLTVGVYDAAVIPVSGATVRVVNASTNPPIDVSISTGVSGIASFPGAPAAGAYAVTAGKSGYSTAETYDSTISNPNPSPSHVAVVNGQTTAISMFIDRLGSLNFSTFEPPGSGSFTDPFADQTHLAATTSTSVSLGSLTLAEESAGVYAPSGTARSEGVAPAFLSAWKNFSFDATTPSGTFATVRLYYFDGAGYSLVPDGDLPGNSAGFSSGPVNLSALDTALYASLALGVSFSTADAAVTPALSEWSLSYTAGPTPLPNVFFAIHGGKTIGTNGGAPVYKYDASFTTSLLGEWSIPSVEWDTYTVSLLDPYDIVERCPNGITVSPGQNLAVYFYLVPNTANSLRVDVSDGASPVSGAAITVSPAAGSIASSACGQAYFGGLSSATYTVAVTKAGFAPYQSPVPVSGDTVFQIQLSPL